MLMHLDEEEEEKEKKDAIEFHLANCAY